MTRGSFERMRRTSLSRFGSFLYASIESMVAKKTGSFCPMPAGSLFTSIEFLGLPSLVSRI